MFSLLFIIGIIGIVYTIKNNGKLNEIVSKEKLIEQYSNLKISDTETLKMNYWNGNLKIYENILIIENSTYFHHIILDKKSKNVKKQPMTISLEKITIEKNTLILQGVKHRLLGNSNIKIRLKSNSEYEIVDINKSINNLIVKNI
ncbi:hypothetical protein BXY75_3424 [Ulvibacter antarcticus]|uniref:Uncharacterized protein n=2 Tax=Ulvibacter antarcticus TaxID=442714 RepID=A0A3L9YNS0_9FLAO|nr:hypothetical protein BXY75_3424 [Ulvibacter antarcticus]